MPVFAVLALIVYAGPAVAAEAGARDPSLAVFLAQIVVLLLCGRLLGEAMQRVGQPAVLGQLIAGMLLGPSVLGLLWPQFQHALFPANPGQKAMIDAVAQLGILLLLLVTGMETDLSVFRRSRRAAFSVSLTGIALPFLCGMLVGALLPASMLPDPARRIITMLFLGTALSISSVKIVAMIVRELGFLRRTVGQVIVSAAIMDDTIGWIIMSVTFGLALSGGVDLPALAKSLIGVAAFLVASFTLGRRLVFRLIRWANDTFVIEMPVITTILVVTGAMALITDMIGVHTVLGALVAGILVGQSPILTRHIEEQLRGLITALFTPVFFGVAGLSTDLTVLARTDLLLLTLGLVAIASIGKFAGAFVGARFGGMNSAEAVALGCGMNARGSTEVIIATIGLSMRVLNEALFTAIVMMAVLTTVSMPPLLRRALARVPITEAEAARLAREELEAKGFISNVERLLVAVDASPSGQFASRLVGLLAGARRMVTTVLHFDYASPESPREAARQAERTKAVVAEGAKAGDAAAPTEVKGDRAEITTRIEEPGEEIIAVEARKGYGLLLIGREPASEDDLFHEQIAGSARGFSGPFAIAIARGIDREDLAGTRLHILVPVSGTAVSRHGAELAISLAQASQGTVSALHIDTGQRQPRSWRRHLGAAIAPRHSADAIIREIVRLGDSYAVPVEGVLRRARDPAEAILREIEYGGHNLLVLGVNPRPGEQLFFGQVAAELLEKAPCSILFTASDPFLPAAVPEQAATAGPEASLDGLRGNKPAVADAQPASQPLDIGQSIK